MTRWLLVPLAVLGCESSTFVDCPTFERDGCLETEECRYRLYGDGTGECRNTCDPLAEQPCPDGLRCEVASYWTPEADAMPPPQTDLCVD